jgi:hypothetical protein
MMGRCALKPRATRWRPLSLRLLCIGLLLTVASSQAWARGRPTSPAGGVRPPQSPLTNNCSAAPHLRYYGGQVIQNVNIVAVYWTPNVDANVITYIPAFYSDITTSGYLGWLSEYSTLGVIPIDNGLSTVQGIDTGLYAGAYTIAPSICGTNAPCTLNDAQIGSELAAQIKAGNLPAPVIGCDGFVDSLYMFEIPSNVTVVTGGETVCSQLCAYHFFTTINGMIVPYGIHPDFSQAPCTAVCAPHANVMGRSYFDDVTSVHMHELAEAMTDPNFSGDTRPSAWIDADNATGNCLIGEIGDICSYQESLVTMNNDSWYVQQLWSNVTGDCITTQPAAPLCTGLNMPNGCRLCRCDDSLQAVDGCSGMTPWCETNLSNIKWGYCVQCTSGIGCQNNQICETSKTANQDDICVGCGNAGEPCCSGNKCTTFNTCGGGGVANECGCTPTTCAALGINCGNAPDSCGGVLDCGTCVGPNTCGGGGQVNQCGCTPKTCAQLAAACGGVSDGCFTTLSCGTCVAPETCGGGGQPNECGCKSKACSQLGIACGSAMDGCGNAMDCGTCGSGETCQSSQCVGTGDDAGLDGSPEDAGAKNGGGAGSGNSKGCGCHIVNEPATPGAIQVAAAMAIIALRLRKRRRQDCSAARRLTREG